MDTLEIIQSILNLGKERDSLREQLAVASDSIFAYQSDSKRLCERCNTQAELIDELRAAIERLRTELDDARSPAPVNPTEPAVMTREQILSVAREALATRRQVRARLTNVYEDKEGGDNIVTTIYEIDTSNIPVALVRPAGGCRWLYLTCEVDHDAEGLASLELL